MVVILRLGKEEHLFAMSNCYLNAIRHLLLLSVITHILVAFFWNHKDLFPSCTTDFPLSNLFCNQALREEKHTPHTLIFRCHALHKHLSGAGFVMLYLILSTTQFPICSWSSLDPRDTSEYQTWDSKPNLPSSKAWAPRPEAHPLADQHRDSRLVWWKPRTSQPPKDTVKKEKIISLTCSWIREARGLDVSNSVFLQSTQDASKGYFNPGCHILWLCLFVFRTLVILDVFAPRTSNWTKLHASLWISFSASISYLPF